MHFFLIIWLSKFLYLKNISATPCTHQHFNDITWPMWKRAFHWAPHSFDLYLYCKKKKKIQIKCKLNQTSLKVYLARWLELNPRRTGVNTSIFSIQWFNWPATYGADSPHVTPINKTLLLPSDAYKYNTIWNLYNKYFLPEDVLVNARAFVKGVSFLMSHNC